MSCGVGVAWKRSQAARKSGLRGLERSGAALGPSRDRQRRIDGPVPAVVVAGTLVGMADASRSSGRQDRRR
jgi:hypothetical protein